MIAQQWLLWVLCIAGGFCLGSVMFCQIIPKVFLGVDICAISDDHNPGATNVFLNCGAFWGLVCLSLDLLKGFLPIWVALQCLPLERPLFSAVLAAPVLGHALAPFLQFHGGKCIATAFGEMLALLSVSQVGLVLAALYILFSTVLPIHPNRIRSIVTFSLFGVISAILSIYHGQLPVAMGCVFLSAIVILKHTRYFCDDAM